MNQHNIMRWDDKYFLDFFHKASFWAQGLILTRQTMALNRINISISHVNNSDSKISVITTKSFFLQVLTSKSCSEEGLEDSTKLLIRLSNANNATKQNIVKLLLCGAQQIGHTVCDHIESLLKEVSENSRVIHAYIIVFEYTHRFWFGGDQRVGCSRLSSNLFVQFLSSFDPCNSWKKAIALLC